MIEKDNAIVVKPTQKPDVVTEKEHNELAKQADNAIKELVQAQGSSEIEISEKISNVGIKDQKNVSSGIALLQEKVGKVLYSDGKNTVSSDISKNMDELQVVLSKINPKDVQKEALFQIVRIVPFIGDKIVNILQTIAKRRQTLQQFIDHLEESLSHGEIMLQQDNAQLITIYKEIEEKQKIVIVDAYFAELLRDKLQETADLTVDPKKKNALQRTLSRVSTRVMDLWAMDNINNQFFISLEMTHENNNHLIDAVRRMQTLGLNVVYVAFAIHAALIRQKDVLNMVKGTREFLGNMLVQNANTIRDHVKEIGDIYKEPIVAINKLEASCNTLTQAVIELNKLQSEGIIKARENSDKIKKLTENLKKETSGNINTEIKSLEAGEIKLLTETFIVQ